MTNANVKFVSIFLFLCGLLIVFVHFNVTKPRLLILHSYDTSYSWTRDVNIGLNRILAEHTNYTVRWHYMDTKRHPDADFKRVAGTAATRAIAEWRPHVVIAIDDDAQEFAAKTFVNHPQINIVFAGVNGEVEPYGYKGATNVTGILERKQLRAVREVAKAIHDATGRQKQPIRIIHIGDTSGSVKLDAGFMERFDWSPTIFVGSKLVETYAEWQTTVQEASKVADYILVTNYRKIFRRKTDKKPMPYEEIMVWTDKNSTLPIIGSNVFNVEDGASLAVGVSPYEQGEIAAKMAVDIIEKKRLPTTIPYQSTQQFIISMRKESLQKRGITLPSVYEAFARATNNYYDTATAMQISGLDIEDRSLQFNQPTQNLCPCPKRESENPTTDNNSSTIPVLRSSTTTDTATGKTVSKESPPAQVTNSVTSVTGEKTTVAAISSPTETEPQDANELKNSIATTEKPDTRTTSETPSKAHSVPTQPINKGVKIPKPTTSNNAERPDPAVTLEFYVGQDSWIKVIDGKGKRLLSQLLTGKTTQSVNGIPPFKVTVGNPITTIIKYNGHVFKHPRRSNFVIKKQ